MMATRRDRGIEKSLSVALNNHIKQSRVLLVGAGGIGCEVLKNLVCCGFGSAPGRVATADTAEPEDVTNDASVQNGNTTHENGETGGDDRVPGITLIDLDTIDLSNLNRQFLFRKHHIKQPKALIAKQTANAFNPAVNINPKHASIFDDEFNVQFFESFDIVFNALDNVPARRHVNKMCLAAGVPLIESGTTGYNGQVQSIRKGVTECYDCNEKPVQKSFPICTIRSTPSQPIHCIVWAKSYLLPELFGLSEEQGKDMEETADDNAAEVAKLKEEAQALQKIRGMIGEPGFAKAVFQKVYESDIIRLASMTDMWKSKKAPEALQFEQVIWTEDPVSRGKAFASEMQKVWTIEENASVFCAALSALVARVQAGETTIDFDKDDKDTLDFVTAAANLRAHIFGIALNSEWQVKQMAGNIIPAIATSNAMTASLCVSQAFKILRSLTPKPVSNGHQKIKPTAPLGGAKMTFLTSKNTERMVTTEALQPPNPLCAVCSPTYASLQIPAESPLLEQLVEVIKKGTGMESFTLLNSVGPFYDEDEEDNLTRPISDFGVKPDSSGFLTVNDDGDKVDLVLSYESGPELAIQPGTIELPDKVKPAPPSPKLTVSVGVKRKREDEEETEAKKIKTDTAPATVIDIDDDGTILLDD